MRKFQPIAQRMGLFTIVFGLAGGVSVTQASTLGTRIAAPATSDQLIVGFREGTPGAQAEDASTLAALHAVAAQAGEQVRVVRRDARQALVLKLDRHLPEAELQTLARRMREADATVEWAEPDRIRQIAFEPNDPLYPKQWHYFEKRPHRSINLPVAWNLGTGSGVVVAVLDTGYRPHADLVGNIVGGYDFISDPTRSRDGNGRDSVALDAGDWALAGECGAGSAATSSSWHGTMVAGVISAVTGNGLGVAGVAHGAKVLPVRVLGKCGGYDSDIADGIVWASGGTVSGVPANAHPAKVLNLSMSGRGPCSATLQAAINTARGRGATVVGAAGNNNQDASGYSPGNCEGVLTVASLERTYGRGLTEYSNYGDAVQISAPGGSFANARTGGVLSTSNDGTQAPGNDIYDHGQGTSMAAAHVSGVAALMYARNPGLSPSQVRTRMRANVQPYKVEKFPGYYTIDCFKCGAGVVDAYWSSFMATSALVADEPLNNTSFETAQLILPSSATVTGVMQEGDYARFYKVVLAPGRQLRANLVPTSTLCFTTFQLLDKYKTVRRDTFIPQGQMAQVLFTNTESAGATMTLRVTAYCPLADAGFSLSINH